MELHGDQVGDSEEYLKVPEAWDAQATNNCAPTNILYNQIAIIPYIMLIGSAMWLGISLWRKGQADWMGAIKLGAVVAVLYFFMQLNQWQSTRAGYDTHVSYGSFVTLQILGALLMAIATALSVTLVMPEPNPFTARRNQTACGSTKLLHCAGCNRRSFFRGGGRIVTGRRPHRLHRGVLHVRRQGGHLGSAGY